MVALRVAICAMRTLPLLFERGQRQLAVLGLDHADDAIDIGNIDRPPLFETAIKRFQHTPGLVDRAGRAFEQDVIAAGGRRNLEPLFDQRQVLVKIAVSWAARRLSSKASSSCDASALSAVGDKCLLKLVCLHAFARRGLAPRIR